MPIISNTPSFPSHQLNMDSSEGKSFGSVTKSSQHKPSLTQTLKKITSSTCFYLQQAAPLLLLGLGYYLTSQMHNTHETCEASKWPMDDSHTFSHLQSNDSNTCPASDFLFAPAIEEANAKIASEINWLLRYTNRYRYEICVDSNKGIQSIMDKARDFTSAFFGFKTVKFRTAFNYLEENIELLDSKVIGSAWKHGDIKFINGISEGCRNVLQNRTLIAMTNSAQEYFNTALEACLFKN